MMKNKNYEIEDIGDPFENAAPGDVFEKLHRYLQEVDPNIFWIESCECGEIGVDHYWAHLSLFGAYHYLDFLLHKDGAIYIIKLTCQEAAEDWKAHRDLYWEEQNRERNSCEIPGE